MTPGAASALLLLLAGTDVNLLRFRGSAAGDAMDAWTPCSRSDRDTTGWCLEGPSNEEWEFS